MRARSEVPLGSNGSGIWNICAAIVVLGLSLSTLIQDCYHRSYLESVPPGFPMDFPHYYVAGRLAARKSPENLLYYLPTGGEARSYKDMRIDATTPYGRPSLGGGLPGNSNTRPFDAPPAAAILMEPLASLPWQAAYFAWQLLSFVSTIGLLYFSVRLCNGCPPAVLATAIGVVLMFFYLPFKRDLNLGNIDAVLALLWAGGVYFLHRRRVLPSAVCFALGTVLKVSPIFALPLLAIRRQWRWLGSYAAASLLVLLLSVWKVGWTNHIVWARQVAPALSCGIAHFWNRSLPSFIFALSGPKTILTALPGPPGLCAFTKVVSAACYSGFLLWCWGKRKDSEGLVLEMVLLPLVVLVVSPISWVQYYLLAVLPLTYLWLRTRERPTSGSKLDLILLSGATLILGSALPDFAAQALGPHAELSVMGGWVASTLAILWVGMRMYTRCPVDVETLNPRLPVASSVPVVEPV